MSWITLATLWASSTALLASIGACLVTYRSLRLCRSTSAAVLSERLTEALQVQEAQSRDLALIRQRLNQAAHRNRKLGKPDPGVAWDASAAPSSTVAEADDKAAVRAELNRRILNGDFKPGGR